MNWNLQQLDLFVAVAELHSFSAAARARRCAQSAVSNAVALLEEDLGVTLFSRSGGRQPVLTEAGTALLAEARAVLRQCEQLDGHAMALARGDEASLHLAVDEAMPYQPILAGLEALERDFPAVAVRLSSSARGEVVRKLGERHADLGLLFPHEAMPDTLERRHLASIEQVAVCAATHPLAAFDEVTQQQLATHRQLLLAQDPPGRALPAISPRIWHADSFYALAELAVRGLGWTWLPLHVAHYPVYRRHLRVLHCNWVPAPLAVELVYRRDVAHGPAAARLIARLTDELRQPGSVARTTPP